MPANYNRIRINLASFDLIKGISIIIIILVHMMKTDHYNTAELPFFSVFHVPLRFFGFIIPALFFISGYGFKGRDIKKMLRKTFTDMIIPYLLVMVAISAIYPVVFYFKNYSWQESINTTICYVLAYVLGIPEYGKVVFGYGVAWISAVWYLLALFWSFNFLNLIIKLNSTVMQTASVLLCIVIGYCLIIREFNYYCISQGLMATGFCYIGYIIKKFNLLERGIFCGWLYVILIPIALAFIKWGYFDLCLGEFNYGLWDYIGASCSGVLFVFVGVYLGLFDWKITEWLKQIGVFTYWVLCIHSVEVGFPQWAMLVDMLGSHQYIALVIECGMKAVLIGFLCVGLKKFSQFRYRRKLQRQNHTRCI